MSDYNNSYKPGIYRGIVESNTDPENLGRCKIRIPGIHGKLNYSVSVLPWARPIVTTPVSAGRGSVNLPDVGDVVWVLFEECDKSYPVYFGGTYAVGDLDVDDGKVYLYIEGNDYISYDRSGIYTVSAGGSTIKVSSDGIDIVGNVNIVGNLSVQGSITSTEDVVGSSTSLTRHKHGGVIEGTGSTSAPI